MQGAKTGGRGLERGGVLVCVYEGVCVSCIYESVMCTPLNYNISKTKTVLLLLYLLDRRLQLLIIPSHRKGSTQFESGYYSRDTFVTVDSDLAEQYWMMNLCSVL